MGEHFGFMYILQTEHFQIVPYLFALRSMYGNELMLLRWPPPRLDVCVYVYVTYPQNTDER